MAIRSVVTMGYGNGVFNGTIPLVVVLGYRVGEAVADLHLLLTEPRYYMAGGYEPRAFTAGGYEPLTYNAGGYEGRKYP